MWTANDCDASKKRKPFKNCEHGKLKEVGGKMKELGGSGVGVEGPTPTDSLADRSDGLGGPIRQRRPTGRTASADGADGLGQPGGQHRSTAWTALAAAEVVHTYVRPRSRPIGRCGRGIRIHRPRITARPYGPIRLCALSIKGRLAAILRHT